MQSQSRGATLLELMIAIMVVAIALAMAVPSFTRMLADNRVSSASNALINTFQYARNMALRSGQSVTVCPVASAGAAACDTTWDNDWSATVPASGSSVVVLASSRIGASGVTVTGSAGTPAPIVFTPRGLVSGLPASGSELFVLCGPRGASHAGSVLLNSAGYIQATAMPGQDPNGVALSCPHG